MTITLRDAARFWDIVADCLVEIYHMPHYAAIEQTHRLFLESSARGKDLSLEEQWLAELVYHAEPIGLAADIAHQQIPSDKQILRTYQHILARHARPGERLYSPQSHAAVQAETSASAFGSKGFQQ